MVGIEVALIHQSPAVHDQLLRITQCRGLQGCRQQQKQSENQDTQNFQPLGALALQPV